MSPGVIGIGGSGGTALITQGMRALPVGTPKLMVSTVASGQVAGYVGPSDICMMYSVTDLAGLNRISRIILANAARAIAGMAKTAVVEQRRQERPAVGLTMFGVTTPCVNQVVAQMSRQLRLSRLPRDRDRRTVDGEARRIPACCAA